MINIHSPKVLLVGPQPPPIHGMAVVNAALGKRLEKAGADLVIIDLAASSLDRSLLARLMRIPKIIKNIWCFARLPIRDKDALYISVSGGLGQVYEIAFLALARLHGARCFLHHHSYVYINQPSVLANLLIAAGGNGATHVTLSKGMADRFKCLYPKIGRMVVLSNAALLATDPVQHSRERNALGTIGFLSNVSDEKGVFEFLDVAAALESRGCEVHAKLAGPFQDMETERRVWSRMEALCSVEYVGAKYGLEKEAFFESIDTLLFPSRNEAEPITIHEALMHGVPVIAYGHGCIGDVLIGASGLVVSPQGDFVALAVERIEFWRASAETLRAASAAALTRFHTLRNEAVTTLESLLREMCGDAVKSEPDDVIRQAGGDRA